MTHSLDLGRIRTARQALDAAVADLTPESAERTARLLADNPSAEDLEILMSKTQSVTFRCSTADVERADSLAEELAKQPAFRAASHGGVPSRSTVLRYALSRGLDVIEAELADDSK